MDRSLKHYKRNRVWCDVQYVDEKTELIQSLRQQLEEAREQMTSLKDTLDNGIKYDEKMNCYVLVWTEKQIADGKKRADKLIEFFKEQE